MGQASRLKCLFFAGSRAAPSRPSPTASASVTVAGVLDIPPDCIAPAGHTGADPSDQRQATVDLSHHERLAPGAGNQAQPSPRLCWGDCSSLAPQTVEQVAPGSSNPAPDPPAGRPGASP